jgi:3-oxoadipate enol-lactonase
MPHLALPHVNLHYQLEGPEGAPVVMLSNSLASALAMWDAQVPAFLAAGFRCLRYDTRGHGQSSVPAAPWTIADLSADALGLLDALKLSSVHFCGLSLGGMTGQYLGTHHGDRLLSLALCATAAYAGPPEVWRDRVAMVEQGGMAAVGEATVNRWFTAAGQQRLPGVVAAIREQILKTPVGGYAGCGGAIAAMDQRDTISAIRTPTLVVVGEEDPSTPVAASEFIQSRIQGAELVVIPDAMHLVNIEQAEAFNSALLGFLKAQA